MITACFTLTTAPIVFTIHSDRVIRHDADRFFGIDLNYIRDRDSNRPEARSLDSALTEMGVKWLRYPGGEKSNYLVWSDPPYRKARPRSLGWYASPTGDRMDFDEFIRHCRTVHAEPFVTVGYESLGKTGRSTKEWIESAADSRCLKWSLRKETTYAQNLLPLHPPRGTA